MSELTRQEQALVQTVLSGPDFTSEEALKTALQPIESAIGLHYLASILNWDDGWTPTILAWVVAHGACDLGTASMIYWLNGPAEFKEAELRRTDPTVLEGYELYRQLEGRLLSADFPSGAVRFSPREAGLLSENPEEESLGERAIHARLKDATPGVALPDFGSLSPDVVEYRRHRDLTAACVQQHLPEIAQRLSSGSSSSMVMA